MRTGCGWYGSERSFGADRQVGAATLGATASSGEGGLPGRRRRVARRAVVKGGVVLLKGVARGLPPTARCDWDSMRHMN